MTASKDSHLTVTGTAPEMLLVYTSGALPL
jgi:hypothetical protein